MSGLSYVYSRLKDVHSSAAQIAAEKPVAAAKTKDLMKILT
jgi:hypothetical protein